MIQPKDTFLAVGVILWVFLHDLLDKDQTSMSFHKTCSQFVVWNWRNMYFYCVMYTHWSLLYTLYIHTYIMCIYRDLCMCSQDCWQGNTENYLWLALLLLSAKSSSPMLRWGCKLSWEWVSSAVSFPSSFDLYLTESACFCTLQTSTNEVIKLW